MNKGKVIVTGGAGYIGSHTVVELVESGYTPIIIDDFSNSEPEVIRRLEEITGQKITFYNAKVQEESLLPDLIQTAGAIKAIIHFAAYKAVGESVEKPLEYYENNIDSTIAVLRQIQKNQDVKLVFSSSCTVYGQPDNLPVTEDTTRKSAASPYGNTKQICEDIIKDAVSASASMKALSLRYFNPIGAHESAKIGELPIGIPANLVPFVAQTAAGIRDFVTVFGNDYSTPDGTCIRDYIHVVDLAKAHVKAIQYLDDSNEESIYDVFNIGVGKGHSVLEVLQGFEKVNGVSLNYRIGDRRPGDVEMIYADCNKANEVMGWRPRFSLKDALKSAWDWQQHLMEKEHG